jgi:hypothetical protein
MPDTPYFTVAEFRARYPKITVDEWPDDEVDEARELAEEAFEEACGLAFVPRTVTEKVIGGGCYLDLARRHIREVTAAAVGTVDLDVTDVIPYGSTTVYRAGGWPRAQIEITFTHGLDAPPKRDLAAVMLLAKTRLVVGPIDERATQAAVEGGGAINLSTPGLFGAEFGIPEVDARVRRHSHADGLQ